MRENIRFFKKGDRLTAREMNMIAGPARRLAAGATTPYSHNVHYSTYMTEGHPPFVMHVLEVARKVSQYLYTVRPRYFNHQSEWWATQEEAGPFYMDSEDLEQEFEVYDRVVGYWDNQRHAFIPTGAVMPAQDKMFCARLCAWYDNICMFLGLIRQINPSDDCELDVEKWLGWVVSEYSWDDAGNPTGYPNPNLEPEGWVKKIEDEHAALITVPSEAGDLDVELTLPVYEWCNHEPREWCPKEGDVVYLQLAPIRLYDPDSVDGMPNQWKVAGCPDPDPICDAFVNRDRIALTWHDEVPASFTVNCGSSNYEEWNAGTNYEPGDKVIYNNFIWLATGDPAPGDEPGVSANWTVWGTDIGHVIEYDEYGVFVAEFTIDTTQPIRLFPCTYDDAVIQAEGGTWQGIDGWAQLHWLTGALVEMFRNEGGNPWDVPIGAANASNIVFTGECDVWEDENGVNLREDVTYKYQLLACCTDYTDQTSPNDTVTWEWALCLQHVFPDGHIWSGEVLTDRSTGQDLNPVCPNTHLTLFDTVFGETPNNKVSLAANRGGYPGYWYNDAINGPDQFSIHTFGGCYNELIGGNVAGDPALYCKMCREEAGYWPRVAAILTWYPKTPW